MLRDGRMLGGDRPVRNFCQTWHCRSGAKCERCRDLEGDRPWREMILRHFEVPGGEVDWECPHGVPWGYYPIRGLGDLVAKIIHVGSFGKIEPCDGCKERQAKLNELVPFHSKRS